jgi:hypothetical protein
LPDRCAKISLEPFPAWNDQLTGIESELVENRSVDVGHIMSMLDRVKAEFVGRPMCNATLDPATSHPNGKPEGMMVAAIAVL